MAERYKFVDPSSGDPDSTEETPAPIIRAGTPGAAGGSERIDSQVQKAQEQLLTLKRQQELIEKQKRELEELGRRQEELDQGKAEMTEKLTRALVILDRQTVDAQKRVEHLQATTASFSTHLRELESINPKHWNSADINKELSRALSLVDHARGEFNQARTRLQVDPGSADAPSDAAAAGSGELDRLYHGGAEYTFLYWLKAGTAFTLPLLILGLIALILYSFIGTGLLK